MVEAGDQQLVAALQFAANGAAQREGQRGHVGAEDHLVGRAIEEVGHRGARVGDHLVGALAGDERPAGVRVDSRQVIGDSVDHALRHLGTAGRVEENSRLAVHRLLQRRKLLPHPLRCPDLRAERRFLHWKTYYGLLTAVRKSASRPYAVASGPGSCSVMMSSGKMSVSKLMTGDVPCTGASGSKA